MLIEERVSNLEAALTRFMDQTALVLAGIHEAVAEIRASNARTDRQLLEMQRRADEDRQQAERDRQQAERDRQQAERDRKDFNKRLAEISDGLGTLIEDMVAPCGFKLAKAIFATEEAETCAIRVRRRHPTHRSESMELDLLAVGVSKVLVVEAKRRVNPSQVTEYQEKLARFAEFFPEHTAKQLCPAIASVYLDPSVVTLLNRQKIHGVAMGDEVMEVVNLGQF